jgi:hypothetical protein
MALCYADSEIAGIPEETLRPYRWDGSAWQSFTGSFTVDPNGIIAGGCVRLSNVTQLSKWGLCSHPVLNAAKNGNDVVLTWSGAASSYEVHRSTTDAYFTPSPSSQLTITSSAVYTDTTPAAVSFYIVQAVGGCGSGDSNTAAAFSYPITSGPTIKYSAISVPLLVTGTISTADDVAAYINSTNPPTTTNSIRRVARWDAASQGLVIRNVGSPFGTPNFNVAVGDFLLVGAVTNAPPTFAWGGDVPPVGFRQYNLVANGYTGIMLPLDRTDLLTADALASAIGNVTRVARWDAATQGLVIRNVRSPFGTPNFNINIGYPYLVYSTVVQQWP